MTRSRSARRRLAAKRKKTAQPSALHRRTSAFAAQTGIPVVERMPGLPKASAALEELIQPYIDEVDNLETMRKLCLLGMLAWNIMVFPKGKRDALLRDAEKTVPPIGRKDMRQLLSDMMARKERLFPEDKRILVDLEVQDRGNSYYIQVAYFIDRPADQQV